MPRVLAMFVLALLAIVAASLLKNESGARRDTYRPRRKSWFDERKPARGAGADDGVETIQMVDETDLAGVRDALSSAPIDASQPLWRCVSCLAFYRDDSLAALQTSNQGRCIACGGAELAAVSVARNKNVH